MKSNGFMSCQLKVDTQSAGWHKTITKIFSAVQGVSYWIDVERGVASVSGNVDLESLLKILSKSGKHAELLRLESAAASSCDNQPRRFGNQHPDMYPTPPDHYQLSYQPPPPSPLRPRPCSTCCII